MGEMSNLYKGFFRKSEGELDTGNHFNIRIIFKTKHTLRGALAKTRPARNDQRTKQCVQYPM
jgi:hypothetical protein